MAAIINTVKRCWARCRKALQAIHNTAAAGLKTVPGKTPAANAEAVLNVACTVEAVSQLELLVGIPEECRPTTATGESGSYQPGTLETALKEAAAEVVDQYELKMAELVCWLIEQPAYRLAGAEEALRQLRSGVEQALQTHEHLAQELHLRAVTAYKRMQKLLENSTSSTPTTSVWRPTFSRRNAGPSPVIMELLEALRTFPKYRYHSMIMQQVTALYVSLRGLLSDQLREVDFCRARLGELHVLLGSSGDGLSAGETEPASGRYLLNEGCKSLQEAVKKLESGGGR